MLVGSARAWLLLVLKPILCSCGHIRDARHIIVLCCVNASNGPKTQPSLKARETKRKRGDKKKEEEHTKYTVVRPMKTIKT